MSGIMRGRIWRPGRQTPRVKSGKVQKKHRWDYYFKQYDLRDGGGKIPIVREPAIRGFRHLIDEDQLRDFVNIVPEWERYAVGLRCLVLGEGDDDCQGWHDEGVVCIHAWPSDIGETWPTHFFEEHREVLDRLMVPYDCDDAGAYVSVRFTSKTAGAFLLMHVFLHELGHHYDRMRTKAKRHGAGGEAWAEGFGNKVADAMWPAFFRVFHF
jgi:hypothetical protein